MTEKGEKVVGLQNHFARRTLRSHTLSSNIKRPLKISY